MRLATFNGSSGPSWGIMDGTSVRDLGAVTGGTQLGDVLRTGRFEDAIAAAPRAPVVPGVEVHLLPPILNPGKVLCVGLNYADHVAEMGRETPGKPAIFTRFADSLVGDGELLIAPRNSTRFDYEGEFAIVIGRGGRHIARADALEHVLGYTALNDGSVRDYQNHTIQFTPGKNFPRSGAVGPWIVTRDEFGPVGPQRILTTINGMVVQDSRLDQLIFGVADLIAYISEWTELSPGDLISTGTPGGVGHGRTPPLYLFPGDVVRIEIDGIGPLTNPVADDA